MASYTTSKGPRGSIRYRKDGRLVSAKNVPDNVLQVLNHNPIFNEEESVEQRDRSCIFCGQFSTLTRSVNLQTVYICEEHYYSETIGRIAQQLRKVPHERQDETQEEHEEIKNAKSENGQDD